MKSRVDRRELMTHAGLAAGVGLSAILVDGTQPAVAAGRSDREPFRFCLNTSTIRGQELSIVEEVEVAAQAGYTGIEPWIREIQAYVQQGGSLKDLRKRVEDAGLKVESAIGFANWIVDDEQQRANGLESAKQDMDLVRQIGGTRIAAPPAGATRQAGMNLLHVAERYRQLLELGRSMEVTPQLEMWGSSKTLSRLGELVMVGVESGHPDACFLPDVYHIFRGGSDFEGLRLINGQRIHVFHMNDYPATPSREEMTDAHRVFPGDGVAPFAEIIKLLYQTGFRGSFSLELFNREYWKQDAVTVAKTGIEKMRRVIQAHLPV